jgi:UDP-2-acetamido-2,6-beta-L-arabino-hexul-4-ose reductase
MMRVGITGSSGFVGSHLRFLLHERMNDHECILIEKEDFLHQEKLSQKLAVCDIVVHLAGLNRGDEDEIYDTNISLTKQLLSVCDKGQNKPKIIFLSSVHNSRDTAYGRSKRESEALIKTWGEKTGSPTVSIVAPNIFGEFCKPNYNSFIATLCSELVEQKPSVVNGSAIVELLYVRDLCALIFRMFTDHTHGASYRCVGREVHVGDIHSTLTRFRDEYFSDVIPLFADRFELHLFNTLRSYLPTAYFPVALEVKTDNRGSLSEIVKERSGGQSFFSTTHVGVIRGNHYHTRKIERFCVIGGNATIKIRKLFSNGITEYKVSGEKPTYIDMPTYCAHSIENTGSDELVTLFWISEIYDPSDPDTFPESVIL